MTALAISLRQEGHDVGSKYAGGEGVGNQDGFSRVGDVESLGLRSAAGRRSGEPPILAVAASCHVVVASSCWILGC